MILTCDFVILNHPKTGSTFVREMIQKAEKERGNHIRRYKSNEWKWKILSSIAPLGIRLPYLELHHPRLWSKTKHVDQHGGSCMVPRGYRHLPHGVGIRNPFELYVSHYEFEWWKENPQLAEDTISKNFPDFPDLSFRQFVEFTCLSGQFFARRAGVSLQRQLGAQTIRYVRTLFREPANVLSKLSESFIKTGEYRKYLPNFTYFRTTDLNSDLFDFLSEHRYEKSEIDFIRSHNKVKPEESGNSNERAPWRDYYTDGLLEKVASREKLLFMLLEELGVGYKSG
jgi:hypothetical protein